MHFQRRYPAFSIANLCNVRVEEDLSITGVTLIIPDQSHWPFPTSSQRHNKEAGLIVFRSVLAKFEQLNIMQGREGKIFEEIDRIITSIHRNASEELRNNYQSFTRKVLSAGVGRPISDSIAELREKMAIKVTNSHDQRAVLQSQQLTQRFLNNPTVLRKQEVLRMLLKMAELNARNQDDLSSLFREVRKKDLNHTQETNSSAIQNIPLPQQLRRVGQWSDQLKMVRNRGSLQEGVSEGDLVRQLSFVFTNTNSADIVETAEGYQLRSSLAVSDTVRRMISELADLGWLHRRITKANEREGAVRRALRLAVQEELNQFYRWIGCMEGLAREGRLSLRKLQVWAFHPTQLLKWLAIVLDAVEPYEGSHILSIINAYRPNGMAAVDGLISRLLSHSLQPLLNYIHRWTYFGELLDPSNEFFIAENRKVYESEEWQERFKLVAENVPSVLDSECAKMIFSTGKAIHFLLKRCKVLYQVKTPFLHLSSLADPAELLAGPFRSWLSQLHGEVSRALVQTLFSQFHLQHHLQSIKHFFLAGKGDFIQQLYDTLRDKLSQEKQLITEHSLDGYISDAILKCFTDFALTDGKSFRSNVADRLLAKKIEFGTAGKEGWECFNFQYSLQRIQPLQVLFTPETIVGYQKIFAFLWRVKQVEETLKGVWVGQGREQALRLRATKSKKLQAVFHLGYLLRCAMLHCINSLHSYLMVTLEGAWDRFAAETAAAPTLDDLLARHKAFQQEALQIALCTPRQKSLQLSLSNLFVVINNFKVVSQKLQESFNEYYQKLRLYEDRQSMARRGITVESLQLPEINFGKSIKDLREIKGVFETSVRNLFLGLRKECEGRVSSLSVLSAKLDFSQYYSNLYYESQ